MSKLLIDIRELGIRITDETPKAELEQYAVKYPVVKELLNRLTTKADGKEKLFKD